MATQRKPRNLNDLARQANVTAATVSMALRDSPQVSVQVREKIRQLAAEQGFTPRAYNRRPRTERPVRKQAHLGPVALLLSQEGSGNNPLWGIREDPILGPVLPVILERFNRYGIDYACLAPAEAKASGPSSALTSWTAARSTSRARRYISALPRMPSSTRSPS